MIRIVTLLIVGLIPLNGLRIMLYRTFFGYRIGKGCRIGMLNLLDCRELVMEDHCKILGFGNVFLSMHKVHMKKWSRLGGPRVGLNFFRGTGNKKGYPESTLTLGYCTILKLMHYFDLAGDITFGDNVILGGIKSVFFTHTVTDPRFLPITIGDNVYVGTNCLFQMGSTIPSDCVVGMGSVVTKNLTQSGSLIAGVPAKVVKDDYPFHAKETFERLRLPFYCDGEFILPKPKNS